MRSKGLAPLVGDVARRLAAVPRAAAAPVEPTEERADGYRLTTRGLIVSRALSNAEFEQIGTRLGQIANATNWSVGDWIVYGQAREFVGAKYERAQDLTGLTYAVLSQAARVAEAFPMDARVAGVSWTHHRAALPLPSGERVAVLGRAREERWTAGMLSMFIDERQRAMSVGLPLASVPSPRRDVPHRVKGRASWLPSPTRRRVFRTCPKCGHRWELRTTVQKDR
jgi:hypothetical protein